jgi:type II secretory pathway pseudopilin PulG
MHSKIINFFLTPYPGLSPREKGVSAQVQSKQQVGAKALPLGEGWVGVEAFTIVETLVTLLAITLMIAAPLTFMVRSHSYAEIVRNKIISTGLAQEGLELATSLRNQNLTNFQTLAANCTAVANGGCMIDWNGVSDTPTVETCVDNGCQLFASSADPNQMYRKTGDKPTDFYRYINLSANGSQSYTAEAVAYSYVNGIKVEVKLKKILSNITIK